jgi:lipopolysaccharide transport system permease protein
MNGAPETVISPEHGDRLSSVAALWRYRDLVVLLARRDIAVRYRQTVLGVAWAVLQPLGMMAVFTLVLGRIARMPSEGLPYPMFVLAGWLSWQFFSHGMNAAGNSLVNNPNLITKVYFPRLAIPLAALGAVAVDLLVASGLMAALLAWYGHPPGGGIVLLPALLLLLGLAALGMGCLVAALTVTYRDFRHLMPFVTALWMWLTPVVYPLSALPGHWKRLALLNPLTGTVQAIRAAWLGLPIDWGALAIASVATLLLLVAGIAYFRRVERQFADTI